MSGPAQSFHIHLFLKHVITQQQQDRRVTIDAILQPDLPVPEDLPPDTKEAWDVTLKIDPRIVLQELSGQSWNLNLKIS